MSWFDKLVPPKIKSRATRTVVPEGVWHKCPACNAVLYAAEVEANANVCPKCAHHLRLSARRRLDLFLDPAPREEIGAELAPVDFLKFKDTKRYKDRLVEMQRETGERDALVAMRGMLKQIPVVVCAFEFKFIGGSMGSVVGERFVRAVHACLEQRTPLVCFSASGGARMQEGLVSLLQMSKTTAALARLGEHGIPYISVLTDPTMAGVAASLASVADVIVAEPKALIGFTGARVIAQTVRENLPEGFQRAEFLLAHGQVDMIIERHELRDRIAALLDMLMQRPGLVRGLTPDGAEEGFYFRRPARRGRGGMNA